ncbi:hypothetical protein [Micromonospora sp. NBC_01796]|uniref:hypothetical protein n=1 Tax=Micromonospora sp. NBC_01796 TaxID=2975987 RepID=UPI002DDA9A97|nr:hypothetical protein [Micromonospora sp. NBC_01796]WSA84930.1 hypothetical protein OIE47_31970 [Micromonospora sp. NBC_01796]
MSHAGNRVLWTVIGLLLTALGAAAAVANLGHLPGIDERAPLIWTAFRGVFRDISPWGPIVTIALGLILAYLGWTLLRRQLRPASDPAMDEYDLRAVTGDRAAADGSGPGITVVQGSSLADGLERDLTRDPQIRRASVWLTGDPPSPEVRIKLYVSPQAPLSALREYVQAAVDRFAATSGLRPRHLDITARVDAGGTARVL